MIDLDAKFTPEQQIQYLGWKYDVERFKLKPELYYLDSIEHAHRTTLAHLIDLVWRVRIFGKPTRSKLTVTPSQFCLVSNSPPLLQPIERMLSWDDKYILTNGWGKASTDYSISKRGKRDWQELKTPWRRVLKSPYGPKIHAVQVTAALCAARFGWGIRTHQGFYSQTFEDSWPIELPQFHPGRGHRVGGDWQSGCCQVFRIAVHARGLGKIAPIRGV